MSRARRPAQGVVNRARHPLRAVPRGLLLTLAIVGVTGVIHFFVINQRAFLNFYYLPVVFGAYTMGVRRGVLAAMLACGIVFGVAFMNDGLFAAADPEGWMRWLDLGTWGCFLVLTAYVVGSLHEERERQMRDLQQAYHAILELSAKAIDAVDRYTENHSRRVADYAVEVARALGMDDHDVENVRVGACLHDIGKIDISTDVLRKAAGLTPEEMDEMRRHVDTGERLVRSMGGILRQVVPIVAYHHERWDGRGYKGLRGEDIPLGARIVAVADTYDAIVSSRNYRQGRTPEQALQILREERGRQFDPQVVDTFLRLFGESAADPRRAAA